jgi:hypothetical protein
MITEKLLKSLVSRASWINTELAVPQLSLLVASLTAFSSGVCRNAFICRVTESNTEDIIFGRHNNTLGQTEKKSNQI